MAGLEKVFQAYSVLYSDRLEKVWSDAARQAAAEARSKKWGKDKVQLGGKNLTINRNPDFQKPAKSVPMFHDTSDQHVEGIKGEGLKPGESGEIWFNNKRDFESGVKSGYSAGTTFVVHVPKAELHRDEDGRGYIYTGERGSIPKEWIEGHVKT